MTSKQPEPDAETAPPERTAHLVERNGRLVATSDTVITDDDLAVLIETTRRWPRDDDPRRPIDPAR